MVYRFLIRKIILLDAPVYDSDKRFYHNPKIGDVNI